ncbi:MAG TPA: N-acetylmuramoyl-L-alanine amidase [Acidimicrobiales bacterium]|nr:N-acetylmuramoyl-L-alanine amidase [Acidimicrobiales bacterium]
MGTLAGHPYVSRAEWAARAPTSAFFPMPSLPTPRLWIHHTGTEQHGARALRDIQRYHQVTKRWKDIAYNFLVDDDGTIYEGRGAGIAGGATAGDNTRAHALCLLGNFENRPVTAAAWRATVDLARHGRDRGWWKPTCGGHLDAPGASTDCPGRYLYARLADLRHEIVSGPAPTPALIEEEPPEMPDVRLLDCAGRPALLFGAGDPKRLNAAQRGAIRALDIVGETIDTATHDALASLIPLPVVPRVDVDEAMIATALAPGLTAALIAAIPGVTDLATTDDVEDRFRQVLTAVFGAAAAGATG